MVADKLDTVCQPGTQHYRK